MNLTRMNLEKRAEFMRGIYRMVRMMLQTADEAVASHSIKREDQVGVFMASVRRGYARLQSISDEDRPLTDPEILILAQALTQIATASLAGLVELGLDHTGALAVGSRMEGEEPKGE